MGYIKFNKETMQYVLVNEVETPLYRVCIKKVIGNEYENPELLEGELNENN